MRLNKVNLCWVLTEGRKGHEIQSMALAQRIAHNTCKHTFSLNQPWATFTPRLIPGFQYGHQWKTANKPDFTQPPEIIITAGRKAAAMGKYIAQSLKNAQANTKHIQILDPKDSVHNYDLLLIPSHDLKSGPNTINFCGSIHPFSPQWFKTPAPVLTEKQEQLAIIIGNPTTKYFQQAFKAELQQIRHNHPSVPLVFCGSPRLAEKTIAHIKTLIQPDDKYWFEQQDGDNPYQTLLRQAKQLFVTADSINMMSECASSNVPVTLLGKNYIQTPKHHRFVHSLADRWLPLDEQLTEPVTPIAYSLDEITKDSRLHELLAL